MRRLLLRSAVRVPSRWALSSVAGILNLSIYHLGASHDDQSLRGAPEGHRGTWWGHPCTSLMPRPMPVTCECEPSSSRRSALSWVAMASRPCILCLPTSSRVIGRRSATTIENSPCGRQSVTDDDDSDQRLPESGARAAMRQRRESVPGRNRSPRLSNDARFSGASLMGSQPGDERTGRKEMHRVLNGGPL